MSLISMLFQLQNNTYVTYTSAQLPLSITSAGIINITANIDNRSMIKIKFRGCNTPVITDVQLKKTSHSI